MSVSHCSTISRYTVDHAAQEANFAAVKAVVFCPDVASEEVVLRAEGQNLRGECPLPEHEGTSPSFYCYSEQGVHTRWWCFRCDKGGDVVDLYAAMHGLEHNLGMAMASLAEHYGVTLMKPEEFMSERQIEIMRAKRKAQKNLQQGISAYLFSVWVMPLIKEIDDEEERARTLLACLKGARLD